MALKHYTAKTQSMPEVGEYLYRSVFTIAANTPIAVGRGLNIRLIDEILRISSKSYVSNLAYSIQGYPYLEPSRPDNPLPPPSWKLMVAPSLKAELVPPRNKRLARLIQFPIIGSSMQRIVDREQAKVNTALEAQRGIEALCKKHNNKARALHRQATIRYQAAIEEIDSSHCAAIAIHRQYVANFEAARKAELQLIADTDNKGLKRRIELELKHLGIPSQIKNEYTFQLDELAGILVVEYRFPDISAVEWTKQVRLKAGVEIKQANKTEAKHASVYLYPAISLRLAAEMVRLDETGLLNSIVINGWTEYTEKATGKRHRAHVSSLMVSPEQIHSLELASLDPIAAFKALKGITALAPDVVPIAPKINLSRDDPRFVQSKEVLGKLSEGENLAAMPWQDFEHLCRELFELAFSSPGVEVKVTRASRDKGVDAVIFDPDPLRGGKTVVQAKRYTNTVGVSAVRELHGTVDAEGALKGILVTTSTYGADAYEWAKDKPLTLINGLELLALLEKHGRKYRIDLEDARIAAKEL